MKKLLLSLLIATPVLADVLVHTRVERQDEVCTYMVPRPNTIYTHLNGRNTPNVTFVSTLTVGSRFREITVNTYKAWDGRSYEHKLFGEWNSCK